METILIILITSILTGVITGVTFILMIKKISFVSGGLTKKKVKKEVKKKLPSAKNSIAVNSVVDQQKIRTAEIEIPVIAEDVLTYEGGELGAAYPDKTRLYYPEDAIKDPEYLETVMRSPLQVQTHQKNTSEYNRDVDGWPIKAWWDAAKKRVMVKGVLHGEENVKYAEENKHLPGFGTSAFISFLKVDRTPGTTASGKPYDAIVRKAVNNHIAILPGIRDQNNVIVAMNAVEEKKIDSSKEISNTTESAQNTPEGKRMPIDKGDFKEAMQAYMAEENEKNEMAEKIKNTVKNELKEEAKTSSAGNGPESSGKPVTSTGTGGNAESSSKTETAGNAETSTETATASNAIPSEEMVKDFSTHLGVTFSKTPSLNELGALVGINSKTPAELISALNAKREEFKKSTVKTEANNSNATLADVMASI